MESKMSGSRLDDDDDEEGPDCPTSSWSFWLGLTGPSFGRDCTMETVCQVALRGCALPIQ